MPLAIDYLPFAAKRWVVMVNHLNKNKNKSEYLGGLSRLCRLSRLIRFNKLSEFSKISMLIKVLKLLEVFR